VNIVKDNADAIQSGLVILGIIPGIGIIADVATVMISSCTSNWVDMGISLASAVPVISDADGASNGGSNYSKLFREAEDTSKTKNRNLN
jgi:hypothetical protein